MAGQGSRRSDVARGALFGLGAALLVGVPSLLGWLDEFEFKARDARENWFLSRRAPGPGVVVAMLDENTLAELKKDDIVWPIPRSLYGHAARYAVQGGAKAVLVDLLFTEPYRTAGEDRELAAAAQEAGKVVLGCFLPADRAGPRTAGEDARLLEQSLPAEGAPVRRSRPGVDVPIPELAAAAQRLGFTNSTADSDAIVRHADLFLRYQDRLIPSLSMAGALLALGDPPVSFTPRGGLVLGGRLVHLDGEGRMAVKFRGRAQSFRTLSFYNVVKSALTEPPETPLLPASEFRDKVVILGINVVGQEDVLDTPVGKLPGPEWHANVIDGLFRAEALRETGRGVTLALILAFALAAGVVTFAFTSARVFTLSVLGLEAALGAVAVGTYAGDVVVDWVAPALAILVAYSGGSVFRYFTEGKRKRELKRALVSYMAPEIVEEVLKDPDHLQPGGARKVLTLFFSDLKGFTSLAEAITPEQLVAFLNEYFTLMCRPIIEERGVIDKFIGDAIMAFFGAPLPLPDHPLRACRAAIRNQREMTGLRARAKERGLPEVFVRIGLHTGPAVVGNMGSDTRFDYTCIGDTVNLASRLEGANKYFGTWILASEDTWKPAAAELEGRELGRIRVVGKQQPVALYEVLAERGGLEDGDRRWLEAFGEARARVQAGRLDEARAGFLEVKRLRGGEDRPSDLHLEAIGRHGAGWDGVFQMESK
jgi:adenylate cyclase